MTFLIFITKQLLNIFNYKLIKSNSKKKEVDCSLIFLQRKCLFIFEKIVVKKFKIIVKVLKLILPLFFIVLRCCKIVSIILIFFKVFTNCLLLIILRDLNINRSIYKNSSNQSYYLIKCFANQKLL